MHKILTLAAFLMCSFLTYSQTITIKGKVTDADNFPLESATIYLTSAKDSAVIDYTISNKNGNWELKSRKITQPVFLKVSFVGLADYKERIEGLTEDKDFGTFKLADRATELNEVVIQGEIPPIRIKSDTLEFNASSFKVRPDANVEALLKQLPGVEIDAEGKITVNGKEVNQILVNGKPFFDKDGKIALQNLPSEIIDKVQVTDTKTKAEEISGQKASGNNASINLTIQEDKNKGLFGKFMGGIGSSRRYESSGLINYFKGKRKISFLGSSNNINSTGFSMNEIFDNMGGGRNASIYTSDNGSYSINGMQFGSGRGITRSNLFGLNYSDEWFKGFDSSASYFFSNANTENDNRTRETNLVPDEEDPANPGGVINNSYITNSTSRTETDRFAHNFNTEFEYKIDSTSTLSFVPKFVKGNSKVKSTSSRISTDLEGNLLNESDGYTFNENDNTSFSNNMYYYKSFRRKGRSMSAYFNNDNKKDEAKQLNQSATFFYNDDDNDGINEVTSDIRDQVRYNKQTSDTYAGGLEYYEPVLDSMQLKVAVDYKWQQSLEDRVGYDYDAVTNEYSALNELLTNRLRGTTTTVTPAAGIQIEKSKYNIGIDLGTAITKFDNFGTYRNIDYSLSKDYLLPSASVYYMHRFTKAKQLYANYSYIANFPQASQVLPIEDISNPLFTYIGNPELDPDKYHNFYFSLRDYDYATRSGWSFNAGGSFYDNQIISSTVITSSAKRITSYENVDGTYNLWSNINWNKSIKKDAHTFRFGVSLGSGLNLTKGFTNGQLFDAQTLRISPRVNFSYDYGELLSINPTYSYTYRQIDYTNYNTDKASNFVHNLNLQTTTYWPKHVVFGNDFGYTYNSNIADGFKKDFFLWNTSLGYNFLNDDLLFKVKVYDLLNQNISSTRTLSATTIRDEENTVLKRYVMFSLTYKFDKFGTNKKEGKKVNVNRF
jgi:hypothetical protein